MSDYERKLTPAEIRRQDLASAQKNWEGASGAMIKAREGGSNWTPWLRLQERMAALPLDIAERAIQQENADYAGGFSNPVGDQRMEHFNSWLDLASQAAADKAARAEQAGSK